MNNGSRSKFLKRKRFYLYALFHYSSETEHQLITISPWHNQKLYTRGCQLTQKNANCCGPFHIHHWRREAQVFTHNLTEIRIKIAVCGEVSIEGQIWIRIEVRVEIESKDVEMNWDFTSKKSGLKKSEGNWVMPTHGRIVRCRPNVVAKSSKSW